MDSHICCKLNVTDLEMQMLQPLLRSSVLISSPLLCSGVLSPLLSPLLSLFLLTHLSPSVLSPLQVPPFSSPLPPFAKVSIKIGARVFTTPANGTRASRLAPPLQRTRSRDAGGIRAVNNCHEVSGQVSGNEARKGKERERAERDNEPPCMLHDVCMMSLQLGHARHAGSRSVGGLRPLLGLELADVLGAGVEQQGHGDAARRDLARPCRKTERYESTGEG